MYNSDTIAQMSKQQRDQLSHGVMIMLTADEIRKLPPEELDINREPHGRTLLMMAVMMEDKAKIRAALEAGANPNVQDNEGNTALNFLFNFRHEAQQKAEEERITKERKLTEPYRFLSRKQPDEEILQMLLEHGADPAIKNKKGFSAKDFVWEEDKKSWAAKESSRPIAQRML